MSKRLGQAQQESAGPDILTFVLGGAAGVGLYFLTKSLWSKPASFVKPGHETLVMPVPTVAPPARFADFASVKARFDQLRDLYHMGARTPEETFAEISALQVAAQRFGAQGAASRKDVDAIVADLEDFKAKVADFVKFQQEQKAAQATAPAE